MLGGDGDDDGNVVDDQLSNQFLTHYQWWWFDLFWVQCRFDWFVLKLVYNDDDDDNDDDVAVKDGENCVVLIW